MELAPTLRPVVGNLTDGRTRERRKQALGGRPEGGEFESTPLLLLLEALWHKLDESSPKLFGLMGGHGHRDANHRDAPSSAADLAHPMSSAPERRFREDEGF